MLLKEIKEKGSISAAAKEMNISFRKAWIMVKTMNERFGKALIITEKGGAGGGGGAQLSSSGEKLLLLYEKVNEEVITSLNAVEEIINQLIEGGCDV